jgi:four helix bundle protein
MARSLITQTRMIKLRHHSLVAWQRADDAFIKLHKIAVETFPPIERFALSAQLRRAAYSVAANIVEGYGRRHRKDRLKFLNIAEASLAEVSYCVHAGWRLGYISDQLRGELENDLNGVGAPLTGLIRSIRISNAVTTITVAIVCVTAYFVFV